MSDIPPNNFDMDDMDALGTDDTNLWTGFTQYYPQDPMAPLDSSSMPGTMAPSGPGPSPQQFSGLGTYNREYVDYAGMDTAAFPDQAPYTQAYGELVIANPGHHVHDHVDYGLADNPWIPNPFQPNSVQGFDSQTRVAHDSFGQGTVNNTGMHSAPLSGQAFPQAANDMSNFTSQAHQSPSTFDQGAAGFSQLTPDFTAPGYMDSSSPMAGSYNPGLDFGDPHDFVQVGLAPDSIDVVGDRHADP
ncbi:hypothetical protein ACHAQA_000258 [Verticillium albo-atrum]